MTRLRFKNCLCLDESGRCYVSSQVKANESNDSGYIHGRFYSEEPWSIDEEILYQSANAEEQGMNTNDINFDQSTVEYSSDNSEVDFSSHHQDRCLPHFLPDAPGWGELFDLQNQVFYAINANIQWLYALLICLPSQPSPVPFFLQEGWTK